MLNGDTATENLLNAWRDATRAAELAERLARIAADQAEQADERALASTEIADQAEHAAAAAERAARSARQGAEKALTLAEQLRWDKLEDAGETLEQTRTVEADARDEYHEAAEVAARRRNG